MSQTFYKRKLPETCIPFNSNFGKKLFTQSLLNGNLESYFPLSEQFLTQSMPSTCGTTTLTMIINALQQDNQKPWKGIWRWQSEDNLECINENYLKNLSLQDFAHLSQQNNLTQQTFFCDLSQQQEKLTLQVKCCKNDYQFIKKSSSFQTFLDIAIATSRRNGMIVSTNYSRKSLEQTGDGHFSPIAGYCKYDQIDYLLMLDVARFKYPAYWVTANSLYQAMSTMDSGNIQFFDQYQKVQRIFNYIKRYLQIIKYQ